MKVHLDLSPAEVAALEAERLTAEESVESVIRRQINPLLQRLVTDTFNGALQKYRQLPPVEQFDASVAFDKAVTRKPKDDKPPVDVAVDALPVETK